MLHLLVALACSTSPAEPATLANPVRIDRMGARVASHGSDVRAAQAGTPPQDDRPEIAARCKELDEALDGHGKHDPHAMELVAKLAGDFATSGPKDKDRIAKLVGRAVGDPRKQPEKGKFDDRLARVAVKALGDMQDLGARELIDALPSKPVQKNGGLLEELLFELGRTQSKRAVDVLVENAEIRSIACLRGASRGLVHFGDADLATRKKIFEGLFKPMASLADEARSDGGAGGYSAKELFEGARDAAYAVLETVAKHEEPDIDAWQRWWNKNKAADWSKPSK
jgi:hypothetical protein